MRISDWSSDVCSSDLLAPVAAGAVEEALDAEDVVVLYDGDQPRFQGRRVGDRAERDREALEIVMVVILAFGLVMRRPRGEVVLGGGVQAEQCGGIDRGMGGAQQLDRRAELDRKSTRLNSSH